MAGGLSNLLAEVRKAAEEAIDTTADDIIKDATWAAEMVIYSAYQPKRYKRRYSFSDESQYLYQRVGLQGYVAPNQTPSTEGDPPPTLDKNLPLVIETGGGWGNWEWDDVRYQRQNQDPESFRYLPWIRFWGKHHKQRYDYMSMEGRPWWSETMESVVNNDYLIINCQEALAKRGIKAVVTH